MRKEEAIEIVKKELNKEGGNTYTVKSYSNSLLLNLFRKFNYLKYIKGILFLRSIDFQGIFKPDIEKTDPFVINERHITETARFWIISWNTNSMVNDYNLREALIGSGPFLVEKKSNKLYSTCSSLYGFVEEVIAGQKIDEEFLQELEVN